MPASFQASLPTPLRNRKYPAEATTATETISRAKERSARAGLEPPSEIEGEKHEGKSEGYGGGRDRVLETNGAFGEQAGVAGDVAHGHRAHLFHRRELLGEIDDERGKPDEKEKRERGDHRGCSPSEKTKRLGSVPSMGESSEERSARHSFFVTEDGFSSILVVSKIPSVAGFGDVSTLI
jgi:hypothetical protein